jgi:hypothetical protein
MYLEILVVIRLAAGREHLLQALRIAAQLVRFAMRVLRAAITQPVTRINRLRERRSPARSAKPRISDRSDEDRDFGAAWGELAAA